MKNILFFLALVPALFTQEYSFSDAKEMGAYGNSNKIIEHNEIIRIYGVLAKEHNEIDKLLYYLPRNITNVFSPILFVDGKKTSFSFSIFVSEKYSTESLEFPIYFIKNNEPVDVFYFKEAIGKKTQIKTELQKSWYEEQDGTIKESKEKLNLFTKKNTLFSTIVTFVVVDFYNKPLTAKIFVDHKEVATTQRLSCGFHLLRIECDGYSTAEENIIIPQNLVSTTIRKVMLPAKREIVKQRQEVQHKFWEQFEFIGEFEYTCNGVSHKVQEFLHKKSEITFVLIPAGIFKMGSNENRDEKPIHEVKINSFLIAKTEVTQGIWQKHMNTVPWRKYKYKKQGAHYAANEISRESAVKFCEKFSMCLPSEAQWEYACRAGTYSEFYWGDKEDGDYAWCRKNTNEIQASPQIVRQKKPNAFGLYDMIGNVWEWCSDYYDDQYYSYSISTNPQGPEKGTEYVLRGGSWRYNARSCRSAFRFNQPSWFQSEGTGFRPCMSIP